MNRQPQKLLRGLVIAAVVLLAVNMLEQKQKGKTR